MRHKIHTSCQFPLISYMPQSQKTEIAKINTKSLIKDTHTFTLLLFTLRNIAPNLSVEECSLRSLWFRFLFESKKKTSTCPSDLVLII